MLKRGVMSRGVIRMTAGGVLTALVLGAEAAQKPNIILILADDLGWSDTSLTGSSYYRTPHLERLAKRGIYFPNAYSASPLCSPTRCSIMTGQSPARTGFTAPGGHEGPVVLKAAVNPKAGPSERQISCTSITRMDTAHFTLAEALKEGGYATGHFGKWHLGSDPYSPLQHGFDVDVPHWPGPGPAGSFVAPWKFPAFKERYPQEHIEDRMGDEAVAFMEEHRDKPFFLNYWQFSVHAPFDAKAELIEEYRKTRDPRHPQQSPTYAAMVHSLDENVGKILNALERLKLSGKTVIIFYSDNGGNMYNVVDGGTATSNAPLRGGKASLYEGGIRVPAIFCWPGVAKENSVHDALVQSEDLYPTILEMAGLPPRPEQALDAISLVPALRGGRGVREAVISYFPHSPPVPEWMPPAICIRQGDWKLLRIFHDAPGGGHRYELYNLKEDPGERRNLAAAEPERLRTLDARLAAFLEQTGAAVPRPNPNFRPEAVDSVCGWKGAGDARLNLSHEVFQLRSFGNAPAMVCEKALKLPAGKYSLSVRIRSWAAGPAALYWSGAGAEFTPEAAAPIRFPADGLWHECQSELDFAGEVNTLRLNPAAGEGSVSLAWLRLHNSSGQMVEEWDFTRRPVPPVKAKAKPVGGWSGGPNGHAVLSAAGGLLALRVTGNDPQLISAPLQLPAGSYVFQIRMKAEAGGGALLFARAEGSGYQPGTGTPFAITHDGEWREISVLLTSAAGIAELRLDPCTAAGSVQIEWMRLAEPAGRALKEWRFK